MLGGNSNPAQRHEVMTLRSSASPPLEKGATGDLLLIVFGKSTSQSKSPSIPLFQRGRPITQVVETCFCGLAPLRYNSQPTIANTTKPIH